MVHKKEKHTFFRSPKLGSVGRTRIIKQLFFLAIFPSNAHPVIAWITILDNAEMPRLFCVIVLLINFNKLAVDQFLFSFLCLSRPFKENYRTQCKYSTSSVEGRKIQIFNEFWKSENDTSK